MIDPRIYRSVWVLVFIALVVSGFSLRDAPAGESTTLPAGSSAPDAGAQAGAYAARFGAVRAGSVSDAAFAGAVAQDLRAAGGFSVVTRTDVLATTTGTRAIETVTAERPGLGQGTVVVVANRDAARQPLAAASASAELVSLARFFAGTTLDRSIELISTSGRNGAVGATLAAAGLAGSGDDAVIALGDLAARAARSPVVEAWAGGDRLAPALLTATVTGALRSGTGLGGLRPSFTGQLGRLIFPYLTGPQAPFGQQGLAAVGVSLTGTAAPSRTETVDPSRISAVGLALDSAVSALDRGAPVGMPSAYLALAAKLIPMWAVRLLVLALIAPVACALVDAVARARRRGHSVLSWTVWTLAGVPPLLLGVIVLKLCGLAHLLHAPAGPVAGEAAVSVGGVGALVLALAAVGLGFRFLRPVGVSAATSIGWRRNPETPPIEAAVVAVNVVLCVLALLTWVANPFTAVLFVPALHLWLWLAAPPVAASRGRSLLVVAAGLALPLVALVETMVSLDLAPWTFVWSLVVSLAGGGVGLISATAAAVAGGVLAGILVLIGRAAGRLESPAVAPVTVRGPLGYAGPGSLGGTQSALRR